MADQPYFPAVRQLAEYEVWCNRASLKAAGRLATEQLFHRFPFGFRTIHATLFHIVEVFQTWSGCVGPDPVKPPMSPYDPGLSLPRLAAWNDELAGACLRAIDASHARALLGSDRRIVQVFHLVTHGTHHRAQFITMLRLLGIDPPFEAGDFGGWSDRRRPDRCRRIMARPLTGEDNGKGRGVFARGRRCSPCSTAQAGGTASVWTADYGRQGAAAAVKSDGPRSARLFDK